MTAFLIAIIIALIIAGSQAVTKSAKEAQKKNRTRTNVELEEKIRQQWLDKLFSELDVVVSSEDSVYHYIDTLYDKYGMPRYSFVSQNHREYYLKQKTLSDRKEKRAEFSRLIEYDLSANLSYRLQPTYGEIDNYQCFLDSLGVTSMPQEEKEERYRLYFEKAPTIERRTMSLGTTESELDEAKERFASAFGKDCPPLPKDPPPELYTANRTMRQRIFELEVETRKTDYSNPLMVNSFASGYFYSLVQELTQKTMWENGFAMSRDGIHESNWQEAEKRIKEYEEHKKKYPWKYK